MAPEAAGNKKTEKSGNNSQKRRSITSKAGGAQKAKPKKPRRNARIDLSRTSDDEMITVGGPSNPIVIRKPGSFTSRKRKRVKFSMGDEDTLSNNGAPIDYSSMFAAGSTADYTWGIATSKPVLAIEAKRRHAGFRAFGLRRGRKSAFEKFMFGKNPEGEIEPFRFMDLPIEIRSEVYGHLLIRPKPILMQSEWQQVFITSTYDHTLLLVSKQVSRESTQVLFEKNVFQTYIGFENAFSAFRTGILAEKFVSNFRNVVIECQKNNWMLPLANQMATCVGSLVRHGTVLNSLTIVLSPSKAVGAPIIPVLTPSNAYDKTTFADFFTVPTSKLMRVIPKLQCKILNIVTRLPENKRVLITIDLRANPLNKTKDGWLADDDVSKWSAKRHLVKLKQDLHGLKGIFERVCEDHNKAVLEGKARLLRKEESVNDGMRLIERGRDSFFSFTPEVVATHALGVGEQEISVPSPFGLVLDELLQPPLVSGV